MSVFANSGRSALPARACSSAPIRDEFVHGWRSGLRIGDGIDPAPRSVRRPRRQLERVVLSQAGRRRRRRTAPVALEGTLAAGNLSRHGLCRCLGRHEIARRRPGRSFGAAVRYFGRAVERANNTPFGPAPRLHPECHAPVSRKIHAGSVWSPHDAITRPSRRRKESGMAVRAAPAPRRISERKAFLSRLTIRPPAHEICPRRLFRKTILPGQQPSVLN
jgi:hypothetical protein